MIKNEVLKRTVKIAIIPIVCFAVMAIVCALCGTSLFLGESSVRLYIRGLAFVLLLSYGMSINMHTGRFDFSAGAIMLISGVCGAIISYRLSLSPWVMMIISAIVGTIFGLLSGFLYVTLRLQPVITGLGLTLVLEGITAIITGGGKQVSFGTDPSYYAFSVNVFPMVIIMAIAAAIMIIAFHHTTFGYDYRALQTGQKISVNIGINENTNAVICYTLSGFMFGLAGAILVCSQNGITPSMNFATIGTIFACFLPLFFSGFIGKYCNKQVAIFLSCIAYEFIQIGFGQISFVRSSFTADVYEVIEAVILVLFLIYLNNEERIIRLFTFSRKEQRERVK